MTATGFRRPRAAARLRWLAAAAFSAACAVPATGAAYQQSDLPDLVPMFPTIVSLDQQAPEYVDPLEKPGRLLYRFDGVIWNRAGAGALDVYRDPVTGHAFQVIWSGGVPTSAPAPDGLPPSGDHNWTAVDRTGAGANFYLQGGSWHFASAAQYTLLVPGGPPRISDKVGFCFFDTWGGGATSYFSTDNVNPYGSSWCHQAENGTQPVRMGVSPGLGDYYWSQLKYQWIDVTDLAPGPYTLRGQVNPGGLVLESDTTNDRLDTVRTIPGPTADSAGDQLAAGSSAAVDLSGTIVGPGVPARVSSSGPCAGDIAPTVALAQCYATTTAAGPLTFQVVRGPAHGTVKLRQDGAQQATATYTPDPGFSGADGFTYRTTDARGLVSQPGTISLSVTGGGTKQGGGGGGGGTAPSGLHITLRTLGTLQVGRIVRLRVALNRAVRLHATLQVLRNHRYRRLMSAVVSRAHPVVAFRPRARGRYVLRLRYTYRARVEYSPALIITLKG